MQTCYAGLGGSIPLSPAPGFEGSNSSCGAPGAVHPLQGWTGFEGNSKRRRVGLRVFRPCSDLFAPLKDVSTGIIPSFLSRAGEPRQQVPSRLSYGNRFCPLPVLGLAALPEREERLTSAMRTGWIYSLFSHACQVLNPLACIPYYTIACFLRADKILSNHR